MRYFHPTFFSLLFAFFIMVDAGAAGFSSASSSQAEQPHFSADEIIRG